MSRQRIRNRQADGITAGQIWQAIEPYRYRHHLPERFVIVLRVETDIDPKNGGFVFVRNIDSTGLPYGRTNRIYTGNWERCYAFAREQWGKPEAGKP
jgi:hypothetical protein